MTTTYTVEQLTAIGGRLWTSPDGRLERVYFRNLAALYGLDLTYYKTGTVSSATLDGEGISNSSARQHLRKLDGRFWYDVRAGRFGSQDISDDAVRRLVEGIARRASVAA